MNQYQDLIEGKKWTSLLMSLPAGENLIVFNSVAQIKSCKSIAYDINSDGLSDNVYAFKVDKKNTCAIIKVHKR